MKSQLHTQAPEVSKKKGTQEGGEVRKMKVGGAIWPNYKRYKIFR